MAKVTHPSFTTTPKRGEGDFNEVHCLTVSDVNILLVQLREQKVKLQGEKAINDIFRRAYEHAQVFGRFRSQNMLVEARSALQQNEAGAGLSSFEHAQLLNLCPATVDEAKSLIPSLIHRISDDQLRDLLLDINTIRNTATSL